VTTDFLTLTQWLSPAFPTGAFSYSHGLEAFVQAGEVHDRPSFQDWLSDILTLGAGQADAVILATTLRGAAVGEMADLTRALCSSRERLDETLAQGAAFARTLRSMGRDTPDLPLPVAVGLAVRGLEVSPEDVVALYLQGFATNLTQIAIRMGIIGQSDGQGVLAALRPVISTLIPRVLKTDPSAITSFVPRADLMAMRHEEQEARLWRS
jgi:urease accessory protein